jgi:hypothetical protein
MIIDLDIYLDDRKKRWELDINTPFVSSLKNK